MLFLLIGVLLIASILMLCVKKTKETVYLAGMCLSLMVQFGGILIFITKKGGYTHVDWVRHVPINQGFFAYSCLAQIDTHTLGVLYEDRPSSHIQFQTFELAELMG